MGFRECWQDSKSGSEVGRELYERKPTWYRTCSHRVYLVCDLHRRGDGSRHQKVGPRSWSSHEPMTKAEILDWLRRHAPDWEMRVDLDVPLDRREITCVPSSKHAVREGTWKAFRDLTEDDL